MDSRIKYETITRQGSMTSIAKIKTLLTEPPIWLQLFGLLILVGASTWSALANGWVQDDLPIIYTNPLIHSLSNLGRLFTHSYWPDPYPPDLYRPLAMVWFAFQWAIGGGAPLVFRIMSVALYAAATIAVWRLAVRLLPATAAWIVAALFAVHPVHVEAVAVAVNQGELLVAIVLTLAATAWIDRRRADLPTDGRWGVGLAAAYLAAILIKEHAVVLPALLVALEYTVLDDGASWRDRLRKHRQLLLSFTLVIAVALLARDLALDGNTKGSFTAEALEGLGVGGRALTMLSVVPEWARLLIWPAHLQADYSVQEIMPATTFGNSQLLGSALLILALLMMIRNRHKLPVASLGVAWLAISLGPVHNVLVPTGIVLAERTLFLGSIGFLIGGVCLLNALHKQMALRWAATSRVFATVGLGILLTMGATRSESRQHVWHDLVTMWKQALIDAPLSYRVHFAYAQLLFKAEVKGSAEWHYRRAIELHPRGWPIYLDLADKYRLSGECYPAIDLYRVALSINPMHAAGRASLIACYMHLGNYALAQKTAHDGTLLGEEAAIFERYEFLADSGARVSAKPGSIQLPVPPESEAARP